MTDLLTHAEYQAIAQDLNLPVNAFIDGKFQAAKSKQTFASINPASGKTLAMIAACGSQNLLSLHSILYDKYLRYQMLVLTYRGQQAVDEHRAMFEAALDRKADKAAEILETHIQ